MTDSSASVPAAEPRCPWCSSIVPTDVERCPSCDAVLRELPAVDASIPGVTTIDPATPVWRALARPNRLVRFIAGDLDPLPPAPPTIPVQPTGGVGPGGVESVLEGAGPASVAPPSDAVRREMARLELEALKAELEANAGAVVPDARAGDVAAGSEDEPRA
ncbi:MAG: hypothetical protein HY263_09540 [Chloroflexi bacterium]|nr:hypothetical protein [Chloroflexota bacterium]